MCLFSPENEVVCDVQDEAGAEKFWKLRLVSPNTLL